jgi:hypothetical protein
LFFIGPLLPGNPEQLIAALEDKVDRIFIDRMNYLDTIKSFYLKLGLDEAMSDRFFEEQARRLTDEAKNAPPGQVKKGKGRGRGK